MGSTVTTEETATRFDGPGTPASCLLPVIDGTGFWLDGIGLWLTSEPKFGGIPAANAGNGAVRGGSVKVVVVLLAERNPIPVGFCAAARAALVISVAAKASCRDSLDDIDMGIRKSSTRTKAFVLVLGGEMSVP